MPDNIEDAQAAGYLGHTLNPTPNEAYTLAGVLRGDPTPETNNDLAAEVSRRLGRAPDPVRDFRGAQ